MCTNPKFNYISLDKIDIGKNNLPVHSIKWKNQGLTRILPGYTEEDVYSYWIDSKHNIYIKNIIPCGKCDECNLAYSLDIAKRFYLESETNSKMTLYITLTYSDLFMPRYKSTNIGILDRERFTRFIKDIYNVVYYNNNKTKIKYLGSGEYGDVTGRPHYHFIATNCLIPDLVFNGYDKYNNTVFKSRWLTDHWNEGLVECKTAHFQSMQYVSQYVGKKAHKIEDFRPPEFFIHSKNLGNDYFNSHLSDILKDDKIGFNGKPLSPPKAFISKLSQEDQERIKSTRTLQVIEKLQDDINTHDFVLQRDIRSNKALILEQYKKKSI